MEITNKINLFYVEDFINIIQKEELKYCFKNLIKDVYTHYKYNYLELEKEFSVIEDKYKELSNKKPFLMYVINKYLNENSYTYGISFLNELIEEINIIDELEFEEYIQALNYALFDDSAGEFGIISNLPILLEHPNTLKYLGINVVKIKDEFNEIINPLLSNSKIKKDIIDELKKNVHNYDQSVEYKKGLMDDIIKEYLLLMIESYFLLVLNKEGERENLEKTKNIHAIIFSEDFADNFLDISKKERTDFIVKFSKIINKDILEILKD